MKQYIVDAFTDKVFCGNQAAVCYQASERTGVLYAERKGDRIILSGKAVLYSEGNILEAIESKSGGK